MAKGFNQSRAIATAVNVVKKWCRGGATGDPLDNLNFPRRQRATAKTIAKGCAAVAEWNAKRALARALPNTPRGGR